MRKLFVLLVVVAFTVASGITGTATAQKKHAPKPVWGGALVSELTFAGLA